MSPALPLIGGGVTRMQPVYVGDVATAVADAVDGKAKAGATYELGGPEVLTMREIMEIILATTGRDRMLVSLPFGLAQFQAMFLQFAPGALKLTPDQVELLRSDNVVSDAAKAAGLTLEGLGITPDSLEAIAPQYLWRFRAAGTIPEEERVRRKSLSSRATARARKPADQRERLRQAVPCVAALALQRPGVMGPRFRGDDRVDYSYLPSASAIRPSVPTMTRHQANTVKPWRVT